MRLDAGCEGEKAMERERCEMQFYSKQGISVLLPFLVMGYDRMVHTTTPIGRKIRFRQIAGRRKGAERARESWKLGIYKASTQQGIWCSRNAGSSK